MHLVFWDDGDGLKLDAGAAAPQKGCCERGTGLPPTTPPNPYKTNDAHNSPSLLICLHLYVYLFIYSPRSGFALIVFVLRLLLCYFCFFVGLIMTCLPHASRRRWNINVSFPAFKWLLIPLTHEHK